ncbi:biliverdin-producing heme oxygenase [Spiractinospora alimapuensis]|uniref:biliverdin-producing heme oxygenase n=1 Tax=Spiractinospora alimapuensis TaxID=2820884 RepID=UPI001F24BC07|nr:biliverdin-producing heme oxygenase [Spiractinospora alimapuensis]QVQ54117.1 biliverdin-producing heme oxygenase [Spiractinospora alimapuensis]
MSETQDTPPLSDAIKAATWSNHQAAEDHGYTQELLNGELPLEDFAALVAQHYFAYVALEETARALRDDPVAGSVLFPELERVPALERDLAFLYGEGWRQAIAPNLPTTTYVARIRQMTEWPAGFVAHHYTRYMGDLSGGQFIRQVAERTYGLTDRRGVEFYVFDTLDSLPKFKNAYRAGLDALPVDDAERERMIGETRLAYQLNVEVFAALGRARGARVAA